jgi:hypothetical protein
MRLQFKLALATAIALCPILDARAADHTISVVTQSGEKTKLDVENMNGHMMVLVPADEAPKYLHHVIVEQLTGTWKPYFTAVIEHGHTMLIVPEDHMRDYLHQMLFQVMTHSGKRIPLTTAEINGRTMLLVPEDQARDYLHQMILHVQ